jgi:hypothetical protein
MSAMGHYRKSPIAFDNRVCTGAQRVWHLQFQSVVASVRRSMNHT